MNQNKKYITLALGQDFRKISKVMKENGEQMNHATARNIMVSGFKKLFRFISSELKISLTNKQIDMLLHSQQVHDTLGELLYKAYKSQKEKK